jgi:hypothetical protein
MPPPTTRVVRARSRIDALDVGADAPPDLTRRALVAIGVLAAIGLGVRIWIMTGRLGAIDSDEAITGLMSRHLLDGEFRAFMWRLNYQGTIVTYPVALSLRLFGTNQFALELPFTLMSAGAAALIWRIGLRFLRPFQAVFAALAFWLWPALYVWIGSKPLLFYVPTLVVGLGMILCAQRVVERPSRRLDWCALGLLSGIGWWTSPNVMYFLVPVGAWLVLFHWRLLWPRALLAVPFAVLGALPWIWNDATYGWDSLDVKEGFARGSYLDHLGYFFTHAFPATLGLRGAFDGNWIIEPGHAVLYSAILVLVGVAVWFGIRERSPAAVGLLACPFVFALVPFASDFGTDRFPNWIGNGRYFYFFTPFIALVVARLARPVAPALILGVAMLASSAWGFTRLHNYEEAIGAGPPLDGVVEKLERGGHHEVFASFWISSRLTFESEERIVAVATDLGPSFQAFEDRVRGAKRPVYVMYAQDVARLADLKRRAQQAGMTVRETHVGRYVIVVPSGRLIAPPAFDFSRRP